MPLLPERLPFARRLARQQQGPSGAFAEAGGEQRAAADLRGNDLFELLGLEQEQVGTGRLVLHHRHAQHDAVVGGHRGAVHPVALVQPLAHGEGPRCVHRHAEGAVQHHAPVAKLVVETLHHQGRVTRNHLGGELLLGEVLDQVVGGEIVQAAGLAALGGGADVGRRKFAHERPEGAAQVHRTAEGVALPERELAGLAEGGGNEHPVVGDVLDLPAGRAEGKDVADAGFVDHLLVEFADPPPALGRGRLAGGLAVAGAARSAG